MEHSRLGGRKSWPCYWLMLMDGALTVQNQAPIKTSLRSSYVNQLFDVNLHGLPLHLNAVA